VKKVVIIGSGFSGLSAACYMAKAGYDVTIYEKNSQIGGRARQYTQEGFYFDMGPTWYWMPDVFESFFGDFNKKPSDYYDLSRLDPGYEVYFGERDSVKISANPEEIYKTFDAIEPGSSKFLKKFLDEAGYNYRVAMDKIIMKPGRNIFELILPETIKRVGQFVKSISQLVRKNIKSDKLAQILEFPVLFLGAKPSNTPAFYCFMNHVDMIMGTWYVKGGMVNVIRAMAKLAVDSGVKINTDSNVEKIVAKDGKVQSIVVNGETVELDFLISGADYHHTETLLEPSYRNYTEAYWSKKTFAPSALMFYVGFNKKLKNVSHHTLFFDTAFNLHAENIYDNPVWPERPLFYASFPSATDESVAPAGQEAAIFLIPVATGLQDDESLKEKYFSQIIGRMETLTGQELFSSILFKKAYSVSDFSKDYNAYQGNAYGLANILTQTAFLKPKMEHKKLSNFLYTGQLTVPGPGVPPSIISGKIAAGIAIEKLK
jgi:phytoene desaturase